jgi:hypothetical protein
MKVTGKILLFGLCLLVGLPTACSGSCSGKRRGQFAESTAYSPNLTPRVAISTAGGSSSARTMAGANRKLYGEDSPYFGSNFICNAWSEAYIAGYSTEDAHDPSGIAAYFPEDSAALSLVRPAVETDLLSESIVMLPTYDATNCDIEAASPFCAVPQIYPIEVKWKGEDKLWMTKPGSIRLNDVEDITILHKAKSGLASDYVLLLSGGLNSAALDTDSGEEVQAAFSKIAIPSLADMPTDANQATAAECTVPVVFPDDPPVAHNIMASAVDPATGRWYMIDDRIRSDSLQFTDPVIYYLTADQIEACDGTLTRLGTLPIAHWLLLHIVTMTDDTLKEEYLSAILDFIAAPDENGVVSESNPNAQTRRKIEDFFGLNRTTIGDAATAEAISAKNLNELFRDQGGVPAILKSIMITGMAFNHDGSKFALSTFGGPIIGWEVGIRLDKGIPAAKVFMQEFLHTAIVADLDFATQPDEVSGLAYSLNAASNTANGAERLIFSTEKNPDDMIGPWYTGDLEPGDGPIYIFSCSDELVGQ